jgi:hypothetical protein
MVMSTALSQELSELPARSLTTLTLSALDFVIPGEYQNVTDLETMVKAVSGDVRVGRIQAIANYVDQLYAEDGGARRAVFFYGLADSTDKFVAAAALANKVGERFGALSLLAKVTPKADTTQTLDLCLKLTCEALAHLSLRGLSKDGISQWAEDLNRGEHYGNESALRLAALIGLDGLLPLGPEFLTKVGSILSGGSLGWTDNALFRKLAEHLPGGGNDEKAGFVSSVLHKATAPINAFIERTGLTREKVVGSIKKVTDISDDKLDYAAAFFDASTSFMSHTGVQTVARHLTDQAGERFGYARK